MTEALATLTYASVVSRESVRIALTLAALNDLEVKAANIQNSYLTAPSIGKDMDCTRPRVRDRHQKAGSDCEGPVSPKI